eukprot:symbB.v1.2.010431.t2/scaffold655.1/size176010/18
MPPKASSGRPCDECDGRGEVVVTRRKECTNCDGTGACAAGRGNKFACPVCNGEGEQVTRSTLKCTECKGTGRRNSKVEAAPQVVGKAAPKTKEAIAPPAGSKVKRDSKHSKESSEEGDEEDPMPQLESLKKGPAKKAPAAKEPDFREGIWWEPGVGLVVRTTLGFACLMNSIGVFLALIGLILLAADSPIADVVGIIFIFLAIGMLVVANKDKVKKLCVKTESQ